jgi:hypothetical protein
MKRRHAQQTSPSRRGSSIQDPPAAATEAASQNRPASATANSRRPSITARLPRPHTIQLCIHCRQNPAGFWVSHTSDQTVRRPWCLSCCQNLDPGCYHVKPFES